jgi:hypothetical protein
VEERVHFHLRYSAGHSNKFTLVLLEETLCCCYKNRVSGVGSAVSTFHIDTEQPGAPNYVWRTQL